MLYQKSAIIQNLQFQSESVGVMALQLNLCHSVLNLETPLPVTIHIYIINSILPTYWNSFIYSLHNSFARLKIYLIGAYSLDTLQCTNPRVSSHLLQLVLVLSLRCQRDDVFSEFWGCCTAWHVPSFGSTAKNSPCAHTSALENQDSFKTRTFQTQVCICPLFSCTYGNGDVASTHIRFAFSCVLVIDYLKMSP